MTNNALNSNRLDNEPTLWSKGAGEMGWPRKDEMRLYQERCDKSYLLVVVCNGTNGSGAYDAIGNAFAGSAPSLCGVGVHPLYLRNRCKRVEWGDLPNVWQSAVRRWIDQDPASVKGFWKTNRGR